MTDHLTDAEIEALCNGWCSGLVAFGAVRAIRQLLAERDEARAKAAALDALEAWLRGGPHRFVSASQCVDEPALIQVRMDVRGWYTIELARCDTLAAAITAALEKAKEKQ